MLEFKDKEKGYQYQITPAQIKKISTRLRLDYYEGECYFGPAPNSRWEGIVKFMNENFPELGGFLKEDYSRISVNSLPFGRLIKILNKRVGDKIGTSSWSFTLSLPNEKPTNLKFPDLPVKEPWKTLPRVPILGKKFVFPPYKTAYRPYCGNLKIETLGYRGSHYESDSWYCGIYANGKVEKDDCEAYIRNGSWAVAHHWYKNLVYKFDDEYVVYGIPPKDFLNYYRGTI